MIFYILPCLLGLVIKGQLLYISRTHRSRDGVFFGLIAVLVVHNFCEFVGYLQFFQGTVPEITLRIYYALSVLALMYLTLYSIEISRLASAKRLIKPLYGYAFLLCIALLFSDLLITGSKPIHYTVTAIKGQYYWVFTATSLVVFSMVVGLLVVGYRRAKDAVNANQCLYSLLALSPIIIVSVTLLVLMSFNVYVSIAVIMPLCTAIFVVLIVRTESRHNITDIRRFLPFSPERKTAVQSAAIINRYLMGNVSFNDARALTEMVLVKHAMQKSDNNVSHAADKMGMKRTTLYGQLKRISDIDNQS